MEFNLGNLILNLRQQAKVAWPSMVKIYISAVVVLMIAIIVGRIAGLTSYVLISDPAESNHLSPYTGLISNLCILGWGASAAICIFTAFVTQLNEYFYQRWFKFFLISGIFSTWLGLDDLLQIHESIGEFLGELAGANNPLLDNLLEGVVFIIYFGLFVVYTVYFRKHIQRTEYLFLILAFGLFAFSIAIDTLISDTAFSGKYLLEKTPKFLGIVSWLIYFSRTGILSIQKYLFTPSRVE
ncbi:membrane hypothetical protein [Planktothrix serta PCC 8927]|uniref:DUF998 domain-containing protein n=1 Tax=Planktothrix serta PCC 8927 TaxID=671068 RepID=A0A7Z9BLV7_9CYAN|nr:hypothetical protein [Planktothrix serta]VXD11309.1 membrane hypothetical protein [Planktothrix serta PCC 8927]